MFKSISQCIICFASNSISPSTANNFTDFSVRNNGCSSTNYNPNQNQFQQAEPDPDLTENEKFLLNTFCSSFGINLPLTHDIIKNTKIDWNLEIENFPFCHSCQGLVENLVELCQQLGTIRNEIEISKTRIRSEIIKSNDALKQWRRNKELELRNNFAVGPKSKTKFQKEKIKMEDCNNRIKGKVEILRELIVGPIIRIRRCDPPQSEPYTKLNEINAGPSTVSSLKTHKTNEKQNTLMGQQQLDEIENQNINDDIDNENIFAITNPYNCANDDSNFDIQWDGNDHIDSIDIDNDQVDVKVLESPRPRIESSKSNRPRRKRRRRPARLTSKSIEFFRKANQHRFELIKVETPSEFEESSGESHRIENQSGRNPKQHQHENSISVERQYLEDDYADDDDDDDDVEEKDDPRDEDFTLNDSEEELLESRSKLGYRLKNRGPGYVPPKKRNTVQCEGEDSKFIYDDRFEFNGNDLVGYICALCPDRKFSRKRFVTSHIRELHLRDEIHGDSNSLCTICGKLLKTSAGLELHLEVHKAKRKACEVCGEKFRTDDLLRTHVKRMHTVQLIVCEYCGKIFNSRGTVSKHIQGVHMKQKKKFCDQCGKGFFNSTGLRLHMAVHTKERPYDCRFCSQRFNQIGHRNRHEKQFHGYLNKKEKSSSSSKGPSSSQQEQHGAESSSSVQVKDSLEQDNNVELDLDPEIDVDSGKQHLKCKHCGLQYNRQNNLTRHLLQIHNIDVKGVAWKSKYRKKQKVQIQPPIQAPELEPVQQSSSQFTNTPPSHLSEQERDQKYDQDQDNVNSIPISVPVPSFNPHQIPVSLPPDLAAPFISFPQYHPHPYSSHHNTF